MNEFIFLLFLLVATGMDVIKGYLHRTCDFLEFFFHKYSILIITLLIIIVLLLTIKAIKTIKEIRNEKNKSQE